MQVQLKQTEIVAALTGYLAQQGIAVAHKKIDISFTAGRKNAGLSAEVSIEDGDIPGFTDAVDEPVLPTKVAVKLTPIDGGLAPQKFIEELVPEPEAVVDCRAVPGELEVLEEDAPLAPITKVTNSLFS